jgi:hypothetical protein
MEHDNFNLDDMLSRRVAPKAAPDLAERIIHAAVSQIQTRMRPQSLWDDLIGMFALPHPSVVVAAGIVLGLMVGVQASDGLTALQQDWTSFLYINEGGWL